MKQVIFVGGTAYCGSTMLDMILANDPTGFSCGEVRYYFQFHNSLQANATCGCQEPTCTIWPSIRENGVSKLYASIFERFPEVEFIVDSSKDPFWIKMQSRHLEMQGIKSKHLLLWKSPVESAASFERRGQLAIWKKSWLTYHRLYATLVPHWRSVKYNDFVCNVETRKKVCEFLEIPYFEGKENYWRKQHHILFGNTTALAHLQSSLDIDKRANGETTKPLKNNNEHRTIYYKPISDPKIEAYVRHSFEQTPLFDQLTRMLKVFDVSNSASYPQVDAGIRLSLLGLSVRVFKRKLKILIGKYKK